MVWGRENVVSRRAGSVRQRLPQHNGHAPGTGAPIGFTVAIDGSSDPEAISDERAYDHVISLVASAQSERIRNVIFEGAGLNAVDRAAFWSAVAIVKNERDLLNERRRSGRINSAEFASQQRIIFDNARGRLERSLSESGLTRLNDYIRAAVKPQIKVYRAPMPLPQVGQ